MKDDRAPRATGGEDWRRLAVVAWGPLAAVVALFGAASGHWSLIVLCALVPWLVLLPAVAAVWSTSRWTYPDREVGRYIRRAGLRLGWPGRGGEVGVRLVRHFPIERGAELDLLLTGADGTGRVESRLRSLVDHIVDLPADWQTEIRPLSATLWRVTLTRPR